MRVRNRREVRLLVPALNLELDPGEERRIPALDGALPEGIDEVAEPRRKKTTDPEPAAAGDDDDDEKENT